MGRLADQHQYTWPLVPKEKERTIKIPERSTKLPKLLVMALVEKKHFEVVPLSAALTKQIEDILSSKEVTPMNLPELINLQEDPDWYRWPSSHLVSEARAETQGHLCPEWEQEHDWDTQIPTDPPSDHNDNNDNHEEPLFTNSDGQLSPHESPHATTPIEYANSIPELGSIIIAALAVTFSSILYFYVSRWTN